MRAHNNKMDKLEKKQTSINELVTVFDSQFFKVMSEPIRVEILKVLLVNGRMDVAAVASKIKKDRSVLSRHLHQLTEAGLLKHEKVSRHSFFEIDGVNFRFKIRTLFETVEKALSHCC
jgi:DNA-binding transcriptional ArsR family regulator